MAIIQRKGLKGLRGYGDLSPEERRAFVIQNKDKLAQFGTNVIARQQAAEALYNNNKFREVFGEDKFKQFSNGTVEAYNLRNEMTKNKLAFDAFKQNFGNDSHFNEMAAQLDADGMIDLLNNENFLGSVQRQKNYNSLVKASNKVTKTYDKVLDNPYIDSYGRGFMSIGRTSSALYPGEQLKKEEDNDNEILNKLYAETQERREADIQGDADIIYSQLLTADDQGKQSIAQSLKDFDKLNDFKGSYYKTFKNSKWLEYYSEDDKLKDYAKYLALKEKYGEEVAKLYLQRGIQNRVAEAQDGKWTGNTLKKIFTKAYSGIGSDIALFSSTAFRTPKTIAILNLGKDPNKPIYDKKTGEIIDYEDNDNLLTNPAYWNDVYKYNTFSPTTIKAIKENGGISEDVNVRYFGDVPDFLSWETAQEAAAMTGDMLGSWAISYFTGGAGKAIGWSTKAAMKGMGLSAKAIANASKVGAVLNDVAVSTAVAANGAQMESMGTFDEQMEKSKEAIQNQINKELRDYVSSIDYNSKEAQTSINNYYRQLKAKDNRRVATGNRDGSRTLPLSDELLKSQAKQLYTNSLLKTKQQELQQAHKKDEMEAAKIAAKSYMTNFALDFIKELPINESIQKFKFAKGSLRGALDHTVENNIIADAATGGVGRVLDKAGKVKNLAAGKNLAKEMRKQFTGGFADEYLDGINASFAGAVGDNMFNNYIKKNYDPKAYDQTTDTLLGNMLAGVDGAIDGLIDRENLYEGFIGGIAPVFSAGVNPNAIIHPVDTWSALRNGVNAYGEKLNRKERLSTVLSNPLLNTYADLKEKDRAIDRNIKNINDIIAAKKDNLHDAAKMVSVLNNYNDPLANATKDGSFSILDSKDNKLYNTFTTIDVLNTLENIEGGTKSQLYQDTMKTMEGLANGTLSKEEMDNEIDSALADSDNKSILESPANREEMAQRLQKNAQYFMEMKDKMNEVEETFSRSKSLKDIDPRVKTLLKYNIVAKDDYKKRLDNLEEELGIGKTDTEISITPDYSLRYGTEKAKADAVKAREREIASIKKDIEKLDSEREEDNKKLEELNSKLRLEYDDGKRKSLKEDIERQQNLIKAKEFNRKAVKASLDKLINEKEEIEAISKEDKTFDEDTILNANAKDRAYTLDPKNRGNFSKKQQRVIDRVTKKLKQKDPESLSKIADAGVLAERIESTEETYNKILDNDELAGVYLNVVDASRLAAAQAEALQRDINENYSKINRAYRSRKKNPTGLKDTVLGLSSKLINAYMEDNPDRASTLQPYYDMLKFDDDANAVISNSNISDQGKMAMIMTLKNLKEQSNSGEEYQKNIEGLIDSPNVSENIRDVFDDLLSRMSKLGYQRDATTLENRKQRIEREEKERKEREEKKKKVEEDAEKSAEDGKKKKIEEEKKKAEENKNSIFEGTSAEVKVDMGKEISKESIKAIAETTGKTEEEVKRAIAELRTEHDKEKYEGWGAPSTALGNTADIIVRDFFAGELKDSYPNITKEVMQHFIKQLEDFRKDLDSKGIHIVSKEVMAHGVITVTDNDGKEHKLAVAGTLDLFGYDDKGNYYIFDMKTTRNHGEDKLSHEKAKWSRQVSMYADLLKQTYGIEIDPSRLQIIPINVYYPTPKGTEKYMNPTGPEYSVDEKTGQLKITDNSGKTTNFVQDKTKDFEMRSTKSSQFKPGYTKADINWDNLPSTVHDATEYNENLEIPEKVEAPKTPEEAVKKITEDTQKFTLSKDETYYYTLNKETGNEVRYPRVTTIISADRSIPAEQQWQPTNKEVIEKLTGKTSSEVADLFNKQEIDNAKPNHEVAKDGSNLIEAAPNDAVDKDASKSEQTGKIPGVWNAAIVMEDGFGDGSVNAGETHVVDDAGDAHKATFTVERKGDKVTFAVDKEGQVLDIAPNEYEKKDEQNNTESNVDKNSHIATRKREVVGRLNTYSIDVEDTPVKFEDLKNGDKFLNKYGYEYTFIKRTKDDKGNEVSLIKDYNGNTLIIGPSIPSSMILLEGNNSQFDRIVSNTNSNTNKVKESNKENGIFKATSIEKKDDGWYFNGNFEGENETTQVKVKDNFDLDAAIERQINATDAELLAKGIDIGNKNITDNGDSVSGHSLTVEEQSEGSNDLFSTDSTSNMDDANTTGNREIDIKSTTLSGNAMSRYVYDFLVGIKSKLNPKGLSKVLIKKKGAKENDSMNKYYTWMDAVGVKLQNIIDYELANILKLNPHAKVKFMLVTPKENATHDDYMQNHLMLVLDYDDSINKGITSIHNKENGGVIESNGKKYLIIGTAGYGNRNAAKFDLYKKLMDTGRKGGFELKVKRKKFFDEHPNERFYVNEDLSTEVEKNYPTPGYIIKQTEKDKGEEARNVRDILKDKERNPYGVKFDDVVWGILERSKLLLKGATIGEVMVPTDKDKNTGNVFVFMPASNGKLVPSPLKVLVYSEMKDGVLKNQIDGFLQDLTSLDYNTRLQAVIGLSKILYLDNKDKNILLRKNTNEVAFTYNGKVQRTFNLDNVTDRADLVESFKDALLEMNPIVNITSKVLESKNLLKQYEEAGALTTDAALFGTAGSNYSIYGIGEDGKMIVPSQPVNEAPDSSKKGSFSNNESQVIYNGQFYKKVNGTYYLKGEPVIDMKLIEQLDYNKRIIDGGFTPVENRGVWNYYILSEGDHPEVVKVNKNTKEVKVPTEEQAKELINKVKEKKEKEKRDKAAQKALDNMKKQEPSNLEDVPLDGTQDFIIDPETGELMNPETGEIISNPDNKEKEGKGNKTDEDKEVPLEGKHFEVLPKTTDGKKGNTQTFKDLYNKKKYKIKLGKLIYRKWSDAPKDTASLERFLKSKDIEVDNIGTSEEDIKAWIKTIEDCR